MKRGFTLIEILIVVAIMLILLGIILVSFGAFNKNQALGRDTDTIIETLRQAQNQTISSKDSSVYGVHITTSSVTLFTGSTYTINASTNSVYNLKTTDLIVGISLNGGGNDIIFKRLTGETDQNGTITISSPQVNISKTVTIYKTGIIQGPNQ